MMTEEDVRQAVRAAVKSQLRDCPVSVCTVIPEISARHVHLSLKDAEALFGVGYQLKKKKDISQPGQYICEERVVLIGPKGQISNVAVLGPLRDHTQVEISLTDSRALGLAVPVRMSGNLKGAADIYLMNGRNMVRAEAAAIAAKNHIHMTPEDACRLGLSEGQTVNVRMRTERPLTFCHVPVRIDANARLAFHMDTDEANSCGYRDGDEAIIETGSFTEQGKLVEVVRRSASLESCQAIKELTEKITDCNGDGRFNAPMPQEKVAFRGKLLTEQLALGLVKDGCILELQKGTVITPMAGDALRRCKVVLQRV